VRSRARQPRRLGSTGSPSSSPARTPSPLGAVWQQRGRPAPPPSAATAAAAAAAAPDVVAAASGGHLGAQTVRAALQSRVAAARSARSRALDALCDTPAVARQVVSPARPSQLTCVLSPACRAAPRPSACSRSRSADDSLLMSLPTRCSSLGTLGQRAVAQGCRTRPRRRHSGEHGQRRCPHWAQAQHHQCVDAYL
jgi:hypothetical protein